MKKSQGMKKKKRKQSKKQQQQNTMTITITTTTIIIIIIKLFLICLIINWIKMISLKNFSFFFKFIAFCCPKIFHCEMLLLKI